MSDQDTLTYEDALREYADALERKISTLTDAEKRQAFLNAILSGKRVEPFATWCGAGDAILADMGIGTLTLNQWLQERKDETMIDWIDEEHAEETAGKFARGATVLHLKLYEEDAVVHILLDNGATLTFQAVDADYVPVKLRIGILGPSVPESPRDSTEPPALKPGQRRREAAIAAVWQWPRYGTKSELAHVFWECDNLRMRTLCGHVYKKKGYEGQYPLVLDDAPSATHCRMCEICVKAANKPDHRRRKAAIKARWMRLAVGKPLAHVFWEWDEIRYRTLCGHSFLKQGTVLSDASEHVTRCHFCETCVRAAQKKAGK